MATALVALTSVVACAGGDRQVTGRVVAVEGDLTSVDSFEVLTEGGERFRFVPAPGLTSFREGTPLPHLREHLIDGVAVRVTFVEDDDGTLVAVAIEDG